MRKLNSKEIEIILFLISKNQVFKLKEETFLSKVNVSDMNDGGMGSILFSSQNSEEDRALGETVITAIFKDADGVEVSISLNIDIFGELYELDVWKTNYSPLISWPDVCELSIEQ
jgi:hypothetical protein